MERLHYLWIRTVLGPSPIKGPYQVFMLIYFFAGGVTRSNFVRSTSVFDMRFKVENEDQALGRQKMIWILRSTRLPPAGPSGRV